MPTVRMGLLAASSRLSGRTAPGPAPRSASPHRLVGGIVGSTVRTLVVLLEPKAWWIRNPE